MVFNPSMEGGVRFDQPVQQAGGGAGALAGIVQGLGIFDRGDRPTPTVGQRYESAVRHFAEQMGVSTDVGTWTERDRQAFSQFSPEFGDRPYETANTRINLRSNEISLEEQTGGPGFRSQRAYAEWAAGPEGLAAQSAATYMYDGDDEQIEQYMLTQYSQRISTEAAAAELARDTTLLQNRQAYSDAAWNLYQDQFFQYTLQSVTGLGPVIERLQSGESLTYADMGEDFVAIMGRADGEISASNIATVFSQYRNRLVPALTQMMRESNLGQAEGAHISAPSEEYLNAVLAPIDDLVTAFQSDNPEAAIQRLRSTSYLSFLQQMGQGDIAGLEMIRYLGDSPAAMEIMRLLEANGLSERVGDILDAMSSGNLDASPSPEAAANMSVEEASVGLDTTVRTLAEMLSGEREVSADQITVGLSSLHALQGRARTAIGASVYQELFGPNGVRAIQGSPEALSSFSQFIMFDIQSDWDELSQLVGRSQGSVAFNPNSGRIEFSPLSMETDAGGAMGQGRLSGDAQDLLERINDKLGIIQSTGIGEAFGENPEDFFNSLTTGMDAQGQQPRTTPIGLEGQEATVVEMEDWAAIERQLPEGASQVHDHAWASPGANPLTRSLDGASNMTQGYAADNMDALLSGPFAELQRQFGRPITINDAIARAGTSRETETPGSQHFHGTALDISLAGMSNEEQVRLVEIAMSLGFQGFGFGNGFMHIDLGERRSWDYGGDSFAGVPLSEMHTMIREGTVPRPDLLAGDGVATIHPDVLAMLATPQQQGGFGDGIEYDDAGGIAQNLTRYDAAENTSVEQEATNLGTPEVTTDSEEEGLPDARRVVVDETVSELIDRLTNDIEWSSDQEREQAFAYIARQMGFAPTQRPSGIEREAFSQREGR